MSQWIKSPNGTLIRLDKVDYICKENNSLLFYKNNGIEEDDLFYKFDFLTDSELRIYIQYIEKILEIKGIRDTWDTNDQ